MLFYQMQDTTLGGHYSIMRSYSQWHEGIGRLRWQGRLVSNNPQGADPEAVGAAIVP
jgi:hypothetical protein